MKLHLKTILALSIVPQIIFVKWFGSYPNLVETYYSEGIYPILSRFLRALFGWIPFSMGDIFYTILVVSALRYLWVRGKLFYQNPKETLQHLGTTLSIAYFIFHLFWGMNYYRVPIETKFSMARVYTLQELERFTLKLVFKVNELQEVLTTDTISPVHLPYTKKEIFENTLESYEQLKKYYPKFEYKLPSIKTSIYSLPLTYMGYGGYLNPFTGEAQVNGKLPIIRLPVVSAHEIGHQLGYSAEDATNFLGFLSTSKNEDNYFKYASYSNAMAYCLSDIKRKSPERFELIWSKINTGVKANYKEVSDFWLLYENPTEPIFKSIFSRFLKINNQTEGIASYNGVVALLVNYDKQYSF